MKQKIILVIMLFGVSFICYSQSANETSAASFFNNYTNLGGAFDEKVADLYSDHAKISTSRRYPHGIERAMDLSGVQWKKLIKISMPLGKAKGDISKFTNIKVRKSGNRAKIKADRYSVLKCYTDNGYYMVIEKNSNGKYHIIEEYMETQVNSNC